jgi:anaerobic selenocysteine-containing dehydrogenase
LTATIEHAGHLEDLEHVPRFLLEGDAQAGSFYSCAFCGVGDAGAVTRTRATVAPVAKPAFGAGTIEVDTAGGTLRYAALHSEKGFEVDGGPQDAIINGRFVIAGASTPTMLRQSGTPGLLVLAMPAVASSRSSIGGRNPTAGCIKLNTSTGNQASVFPIHIEPSLKRRGDTDRQSLKYEAAIESLAELLLRHRPPHGRTLVYGCGQIDYFTIFALQEVFRLLGVTNLAGNAEHCLNAGAVHNEMLTGQEGPFLTINQAVEGERRFYLLNGWNGLITHPPVFHAVLKRKDLDAYLVEVAITESGDAFIKKMGPDRLLLIRSGSDPHLALGVAHELLSKHPNAIHERFVSRFADRQSFDRFTALAREERFSVDNVATEIAAEPELRGRISAGIVGIAAKLADPSLIPINIPSVGLSQTKGAVAHALWGSTLALTGKYGLRPDGTPAGGTLRIPGQINAESEVQGMSRRIFMGRIRRDAEGSIEAARRMGLPDDAYDVALNDTPRAALDYSDEATEPELIISFGTQFESNMMERERWIRKLENPLTTLVVVDPIPDPYTVAHADLIIPSPPHVAAAKLYQNGEWRMSLSIPTKRAAAETRTDATIIYDAMAAISRRLRVDDSLRGEHAALAPLSDSGYLRERFENLPRVDGEVSRSVLWKRILDYMSGGRGPLYCRPDHDDGEPIQWRELLEKGSIVYGGVGTSRFMLDYDNPAHMPFRDIYRNPRPFTFFGPSDEDLRIPGGVILNSGRSTLSDDKARIRFAVGTFNSGKATTAVDMPAENPLHISPMLAASMELKTGDRVRVINSDTSESMEMPVVVNERAKGNTIYVSFHKTRAELERGVYLNKVTSHIGRCPYTAQSNFKATSVRIERLEES